MANDVAPQLDKQFFAGTDVASFFLYHPQDLQHRLTSPAGWPYCHYACQPEFEAGRFVAFATGSDGNYEFRVTNGDLTDREKTWLAGAWDFRYIVRHGCAYIDGGYALPSDNFRDDSKDNPDQWISLPNGNYRVTVSAIEWYSEPGAMNDDGEISEDSLPNYVIQIRPVESLEAIDPPSTPPRLDCSRDSPARLSISFAEFDNFDGNESELSGQYPALCSKEEVPIPGFKQEIEVSDDQYKSMFGSRDSTMLSDRIEQIVIACDDKPPCLGVLAQRTGASKTDNQPWIAWFEALQLLTITSFQSTKPWLTCHVEFLHRPASTVSPERIEELKAAFARYGSSNASYLRAYPTAVFEGEMIASLNSPTGLTHVLIHHIQMPNVTRLELLPLSNASRCDRLLELLKELTD